MILNRIIKGVKMLYTRAPAKVGGAVKAVFSDKYIFYTNVVMAFGLTSTGDIIVQVYEKKVGYSDSWNKTRTRNMGIVGMEIGLICYYWYQFLERRLPGYTIKVVMKKVILDEIFCGPTCIATLFLTLGLLEGSTGKELLLETKEKALRLYAADWILWPPANFINFYYIPLKYRVIYENCCYLVYDVYMSYVKNTKKPDGSLKEVEEISS